MITYNSRADRHYLSKHSRQQANLPILHSSTKWVGVANRGVNTRVNVNTLPFQKLSKKAVSEGTFNDFSSLLMSVGQVADDNNISIFTKDGVTVHNKQEVIITYRVKPILIGVQDNQGRYQIPLIPQKGQWQPQALTKVSTKYSIGPTLSTIYHHSSKKSSG